MNRLHKLISVSLVTALLTTGSTRVEGLEYCTDTGGCAYEGAHQACCLVPAIALALVALGTIIAVGVHNRSGAGHAHAHN